MTVEELLAQKGILFTTSGHDYLIHCLNPEHDDKSPSCRVDKISGIFHCFSCSYKGNLFTLFGVLRNRASERVNTLLKQIDNIRWATSGLEIPVGSVPFRRNYRGISSSTYAKFEAFLNSTEYPDRIAFPIRDISGRIAVIQTRAINGNPKDKYRNYPSGVKLFPFPQVVKPYQGTVILVEGLFDMLNLYDKGLTNTVCLFGTNTLSMDSIENSLKNYRLQGVEKILVLLDGDQAGRNATKKVVDAINQKTTFYVEEVFLDEQDPGELTLEEVKRLKIALYEDI